MEIKYTRDLVLMALEKQEKLNKKKRGGFLKNRKSSPWVQILPCKGVYAGMLSKGAFLYIRCLHTALKYCCSLYNKSNSRNEMFRAHVIMISPPTTVERSHDCLSSTHYAEALLLRTQDLSTTCRRTTYHTCSKFPACSACILRHMDDTHDERHPNQPSPMPIFGTQHLHSPKTIPPPKPNHCNQASPLPLALKQPDRPLPLSPFSACPVSKGGFQVGLFL